MAADSAGSGTVTTVVTCEGDLGDPGFGGRLEAVLAELNGLLGSGGGLKVRKLEPWNSVRVTLSIPREAALRLRQLANDGSQQLRALGILSVQVEGDQVISLRLAGTATTEPQEIVLRTGQDGNANGSSSGSNLSQLLTGHGQTESPAPSVAPQPPPPPSEKVQFRSPNVVCPPDTIVPKVPAPGTISSATPTPPTKGYAAGPFPFTSMNQAMHTTTRETPGSSASSAVSSFTAPPPPYPGKHPPVTLSSPLLVNLLQNEGGGGATSSRNSGQQEQAVEVNAMTAVTATQRMPSTNFISNKLSNVQPPRNKLTTTNSTISRPILPPQQQQKPTSQTTLKDNNNSSLVKKTIPQNNNARNPVPYNNIYPPPYPANVTTNTAMINNNNNNSCNNSSSTRQWEQNVQPMPLVQELVPSLTDLKADLDHLLPSLERELAGSPPDLPDELLNHHKERTVYLINPLTGELEPTSSGDSDEEEFRDVFTGLPSPSTLSDEDTNSTIRPDTTDQSDSESRSCHSDSSKHFKLKSSRNRDKGRDSPVMKPTEKIKLRLKLEKSEPVISPAYKVDVSFINTQQPKKAVPTTTVTPGEELRVPPLHISLRGRNHVVINNKKKAKLMDGVKLKGKKDSVGSGDEQEFETTRKSKSSTHYTDKLMLRRGSDSDLSRNKKYECNGILSEEKKRRLSQTEENPVLGSTNTGTVTGLGVSHKARKDKVKLKENFKNKDFNRFKSYSKNIAEKLNKQQQVVLPTGEIDMEAKFKQRLLEDSPIVKKIDKEEELIQALTDPPPLKDKPPEPDKCNTPDRKEDKQQPNRSPNSGAQGEDSGIESMDALSEKSPNQASQSPHAEIPKPQVPDILDIEAQLAKMEGLHADDLNENHNNRTEDHLSEQCCVLTSLTSGDSDVMLLKKEVNNGVLTSVLQDTLSKTTDSLVKSESLGQTKVLQEGLTKTALENCLSATLEDKPTSSATSLSKPDLINPPQEIIKETNVRNQQIKDFVHAQQNIKDENVHTQPNLIDSQQTIKDEISHLQHNLKDSGNTYTQQNLKDDKYVQHNLNDAQHNLKDGCSTFTKKTMHAPHNLKDSVSHTQLNVKEAQHNLKDGNTHVLAHLNMKDEGNAFAQHNLKDATHNLRDTQLNIKVQQNLKDSKTYTQNNLRDTQLNIKDGINAPAQHNLKDGSSNMYAQHNLKEGVISHVHHNAATNQAVTKVNSVHKTQTHEQLSQQKNTHEVLVNSKKDTKHDEEEEPVPMRVTPPLYTYSNPEKRGPDSPLLSDSDSNLCNPTTATTTIKKSLLEQLLIEIPENQTPSSPSPATRSVRTRASSKMNSPDELNNSPIITNNKVNNAKAGVKRKRHESDSSNHSLEDQKNKKPTTRKCSENLTTDAHNKVVKKSKVVEESSDSDEPLIEVAGKVRKNTQTQGVSRVKLKGNNGVPMTGQAGLKNIPSAVNTRRSIRTMPVINTRSKGDKSNPDSDVIRRKTRSAVSEGEGKRRKDVK